MKTLYKLLILSLVLLSTTYNYAQIDTTIYYPFKIGNYWQYGTNPPSEIFQIYEIIGEVTFNGKLYYKFREYDGEYETIRYFRTEGENNEKIYRYVGAGCQTGEGLYYDFTVPDSSIWPSCASIGIYTSLIYTEWKLIDFLNESFTTVTFVDADIDSTVTPPDTIYYRFYYEKIAKGIGVVEWYGELAPLLVLEGMVLDGIHYGNTSLFVGLDDDEDQVITDFILHQNYPNPFNPVTKIKYEIPDQVRNDNVKIKVYDVLGNEVATLVDEYKPAGTYEVEFNANSHSREGGNLSSGIYFYRLSAGNFVETRKMMLLK